MNIQKLEQTKDSLKSIGQRFSAPSPLFFKKIMKLCAAFVAASVAVLALPLTTPVVIPSILTTICSNIAIAGTFGGIVAKFGVDWNEVEKQKEEQE